MSDHPHSPDEWMLLCRQRRDAAYVLLKASKANATWEQCGFAVEACLKAAIMTKERKNRWPSTQEDPKLWTHDLQYLAGRLGISPETFNPKDPSAASWKMVFGWHRGHGYSINKVPLKFASQMHEAAFGPNGVVEWLSKRYRLNI